MFVLPALPYGYDALEPFLSAETLRTHHDKHHAKYVDTVNTLTRGGQTGSLEALISLAAMAPNRQLFNNAAQAWNHGFFWACMSPEPSAPGHGLAAAIVKSFGDLATLRQTFIDEGLSHFGSGWVWLAAEDMRLSVFATHDADTVVTRDLTPLLVCDLWEHAYYLDYKNDRAAFLAAWWDRLANWAFADAQFTAQVGGGERWRYPPRGESRRGPVLADQAAYEIALEDAIAFMDHPPRPGTEQAMRFADLLDEIVRFQACARPAAARSDEHRSPMLELERRIAQVTRALGRERPDGNEHWSPMIGGDVSPPVEPDRRH